MAVVAYGRAFNGTNAYVEIPMVGEAGTRMLWVYLSPRRSPKFYVVSHIRPKRF